MTPHLVMLVGQGAGHDTTPRVVGMAWHGPPPGVASDPLPLHRHNSWQGGIKVRKESLYCYNWDERRRFRQSTGNDGKHSKFKMPENSGKSP